MHNTTVHSRSEHLSKSASELFESSSPKPQSAFRIFPLSGRTSGDRPPDSSATFSSKAPYLTRMMNPAGARRTPSDTGFSPSFSSDQTNVAFAPG